MLLQLLDVGTVYLKSHPNVGNAIDMDQHSAAVASPRMPLMSLTKLRAFAVVVG